MILKFGFLLFISTFVDGTLVEIEDGIIRGKEIKTRLGEDMHIFLRIPYAAPPVDTLRFQAPQPVKRWNGTLDGTNIGAVCFQTRTDGRMSENCLQLNVYTKSLNASRPVLVFIHGGALEFGSGIDQGPLNMMDRDVVVVMINYRLGALGFLSLGTKEIPGNAGFKDQVMALQWVNKNIHKFGGNKNLVTIVGQSAGGISATAHMASSMSKGLFHRVVSMSGSITMSMPFPVDTILYAKMIGKSLNCTGDLGLCLMKANASEITAVDIRLYSCQIITWGPVIEKDFNQTRFFSEQPSESFRTGNFNKVPLIIGRTNDEFVQPVPGLLLGTALKIINSNFTVMAPYCFSYFLNTESRKTILSEHLKQVFLPINSIDSRSFAGLTHLFSDGAIGYPIHKLVHLITNQTAVFYYKFTYIGRFGFSYPNNGKPYGVCHGDDLSYYFPVLEQLTNRTDPDNFMIERMTKIIETFAVTGNPNYDTRLYEWPQHTLANEFYLDIGTNLVKKNGLFLERYTIWDELMEL